MNSVVKVTGTSEIAVSPDTAVIEFGLVVRGRSPKKTEQDFREKLGDVDKAIEQFGLPEGVAFSSQTRIRPLHGSGKNRAKEVGFEAKRDFTIELVDLTKVSSVAAPKS